MCKEWREKIKNSFMAIASPSPHVSDTQNHSLSPQSDLANDTIRKRLTDPLCNWYGIPTGSSQIDFIAAQAWERAYADLFRLSAIVVRPGAGD
jgi:hypothetical protein